MGKHFVGFGFGPIQAGLMLLEACESGAFSDYTVAEVDADLVGAVREAGGEITVNVAFPDGIERKRLRGIVLCNPNSPAGRRRLEEAVAVADEMATAVPSVALYDSGEKTSVARILAAAVNPEKPQILYAAENNNHAARILRDAIARHASDGRLRNLCILDTVIGKMSGMIRDRAVMAELGLEPLVHGYPGAVLVESFNRILVSRSELSGCHRGIAVFEEKEDLLPFEEAKLHGHNAVHALLGYLAALKGYSFMSDIRTDGLLSEIGRRAFAESGETFVRKYGHLGDPLFTPEGFRSYGEDLLRRMTSPYLHDPVDRVCRDPARKLGLDDRLIGTMREALKQGVLPETLALGAAAAVLFLCHGMQGAEGCPEPGAADARPDAETVLISLWRKEPEDGTGPECRRLVRNAMERLRAMGR